MNKYKILDIFISLGSSIILSKVLDFFFGDYLSQLFSIIGFYKMMTLFESFFFILFISFLAIYILRKYFISKDYKMKLTTWVLLAVSAYSFLTFLFLASGIDLPSWWGFNF